MNIKYFRSQISDANPFLEDQRKAYLRVMENDTKFLAFNQELLVIFIETGGTEEAFKKVYEDLTYPLVIVSTNANNSLPAALEIASFLKSKNKKYLLLHGTPEEVTSSMKEKRLEIEAMKVSKEVQVLKGKRYGVVGEPSDWLIASMVDDQQVKQKLGVELVHIPFEEFAFQIDHTKEIIDPVTFEHLLNNKIKKEVLDGALKIYSALRSLIIKYELNGLTVRCFDLLGTYHNTSCLALALLNKDGYIATCEGDVPTMLTMALAREVFHVSSFQANPSYINLSQRFAYFAHCTLPLDMCLDYTFDTHFESGLGIGIKGRLNLGKITLLKVNKDFTKFHAIEGKITANLGRNDLCRSQVKVQFDEPIDGLFSDPLGNHIVLIYGSHKEDFIKIFQ